MTIVLLFFAGLLLGAVAMICVAEIGNAGRGRHVIPSGVGGSLDGGPGGVSKNVTPSTDRQALALQLKREILLAAALKGEAIDDVTEARAEIQAEEILTRSSRPMPIRGEDA